MEQSVLIGDKIFSELSQGLLAAKKRIIVVTAWFKDPKLFEILVSKQKEGVDVSVIISDNKEDENLDFSELVSSGGTFYKVERKGYGMMHQKFCVIDGKLAFHGSYNWTINARTNNSESVIKTNHKKTIEELLSEYKKLNMIKEETVIEPVKNKKGILQRLINRKRDNTENEENKLLKSKEIIENDIISIDEVFNSIITAEEKKTDDVSLKKKGNELCKEVNGDHNVLPKSMISLYHLYLEDNAENIELKNKLAAKIHKKKEELIQLQEIERAKKLESDEVYELNKEKELAFEKSSREKELDLTKKDIEIQNSSIDNLKNKIIDIREKISNLELDFMKPSFNWLSFLPIFTFIVGLGAYLMLFYSSSLYIMIYSLQDSMELIKAGVSLEDINPQVFDSQALSRAFDKEGVAGYFILLFFFVPLVIAYVSHLKSDVTETRSTKDKIKMVFCYLIVIMIDAFIATKVTSTIIQIKIEAKKIPPNFELTLEELLSDLNFWLVFCLGAVPFVFLSILIEKLSEFFKERSPEIEIKKLKFQKKNFEKEILQHSKEIDSIDLEINQKGKDVVRLKNEIIEVDKKTYYLPIEVNKMKTSSNNLIDKIIDFINNKASLFLNDIDNDNISISSSTLQHRISSFIGGWEQRLYEEYSIEKAQKMRDNAEIVVENWKKENSILISKN